MQRLDDAEFGRRQRERNLRANRQRRERLMAAGYTQWNLWIAGETRALAEQLAAQRKQSPSEFIAALVLSAAPARALSEPLPLFDAPATPVEDAPALVDRDSRILALKREQPELSNYAIAAQVGCSEATARRVVNRAKQEESAP